MTEGERGGDRDREAWSKPVSKLTVTGIEGDVVNLNVEGRRVVSPIQGFGKMWQKTYRIRLTGVSVSPPHLIKTWKENFASFWPEGSRFHAPITGIAPGEVAVLNLKMPGKLRLSTGMLVLYADEESFTLMTPEGHQFAGWITFSAYEDAGTPVAQVQVLIRANDPIYEASLAMFGHRMEDRFWDHTLRSLAAHLGAEGVVERESVCVDRRRQWSKAGNVWHNAAVRSAIYTAGAPVRWAARSVRRTSG